MKMNVVDFAYQIIEMNRKIIDLEIENKRLRGYEEKYHELLDQSLSHNEAMLGNIFKICTTPGVVPALQENETFGIEE